MQKLSLAIATNHNGNAALVLSMAGRVVYETVARLPHDATQKNYASALRLLADCIEDADLTLAFK